MLIREPIGPREAMWRDTLENGSAADRADAALRLGRMLHGVGDTGSAEALLREAADSCCHSVVPRACWALAEVLAAKGRSEEAAKYLSRAAASADSRNSPDVVLALASRYAALGQVDAAVATYRAFLDEADESERELTALAAQRLADICRERGELKQAMALFIRAFRDGSKAAKPHAAIALVDLALEQELPDLAESLCRWVLASEHADLAPRAGYQLALLRHEAGDHLEALHVLRAVALSAHPMYAPMAEQLLLPLIGELDVSQAVDDLVEEVLGDGQLRLAPTLDALHSNPILTGPWCRVETHACEPKCLTHYVLVATMRCPMKSSWALQIANEPRQLEAGDRLTTP